MLFMLLNYELFVIFPCLFNVGSVFISFFSDSDIGDLSSVFPLIRVPRGLSILLILSKNWLLVSLIFFILLFSFICFIFIIYILLLYSFNGFFGWKLKLFI